MRVETFVEFLYPGMLFSETQSRRVTSRDRPAALPTGAIAYRHYDRTVLSATREDGVQFEVPGKPENVSRWTFVGEELTLADVERLAAENPAKYARAVDNMKHSGITRVCRTLFGNFMSLEDGDLTVSPDQW